MPLSWKPEGRFRFQHLSIHQPQMPMPRLQLVLLRVDPAFPQE